MARDRSAPFARLRFALLGLLSLLALLAATPASASSMLAYDIPTLTSKSDLVVRGTVLRAEGKWAGKRIVTEVTVRVDSTLKGGAASEVKLYVLGGVVDGVGMKVAGSPAFAPKEEVLVFLRWQKGAYSLVGLGQGKWRIEAGAEGRLAVPEVAGLSLVKKRPDGTLEAAPLPRTLKLSELEAEIARAQR